MKTKTLWVAFLCIGLLTRCGSDAQQDNRNGDYESISQRNISEAAVPESEETASEDSSANGFISSSAAQAHKDSSRRFVRTADMRFKVKNVRTSTFTIEDVVAHFDGYVTYTHLASEVNRKTLIPVSKDSLLSTTYFTVSNNMTIRIPNEHLDSALRIIAREITFLDYRTIKAEDVTLQMLANKMARKRLAKTGNRVADRIDKRNDRLYESVYAEDHALTRGTQADAALLENLRLQSEVDLSTIQLTFYQAETMERELVYNNEDIEEYRPGFGSRLGESLYFGWNIVLDILLGLARIWPLFLIGFGLYVLIKRLIK